MLIDLRPFAGLEVRVSQLEFVLQWQSELRIRALEAMRQPKVRCSTLLMIELRRGCVRLRSVAAVENRVSHEPSDNCRVKC